jgi:predicted alpha/beta hydrolase family esterase
VRRRFLLLHGIENRRPPEHWQHWLAERLRARGEQVLYPQLPDPDAPRFDAWEQYLNAELEMLGDGERVVVCHSLGCALWLAAGPRRAVDRVLLVAPPGRRVVVRVAPSFADAARRRGPDAAAGASRSITIACSDGDPFNPDGEQPALAEAIGARLHVAPGAGHFAVGDGYGPWPAVERWCLDPASERF